MAQQVEAVLVLGTKLASGTQQAFNTISRGFKLIAEGMRANAKALAELGKTKAANEIDKLSKSLEKEASNLQKSYEEAKKSADAHRAVVDAYKKTSSASKTVESSNKSLTSSYTALDKAVDETVIDLARLSKININAPKSGITSVSEAVKRVADTLSTSIPIIQQKWDQLSKLVTADTLSFQTATKTVQQFGTTIHELMQKMALTGKMSPEAILKWSESLKLTETNARLLEKGLKNLSAAELNNLGINRDVANSIKSLVDKDKLLNTELERVAKIEKDNINSSRNYAKALRKLGEDTNFSNEKSKVFVPVLQKLQKALDAISITTSKNSGFVTWAKDLDRASAASAALDGSIRITSKGIEILNKQGLEALGVKSLDSAKKIGLLGKSFEPLDAAMRSLAKDTDLSAKSLKTIRDRAVESTTSFKDAASVVKKFQDELKKDAGVQKLIKDFDKLLSSETRFADQGWKLIEVFNKQGGSLTTLGKGLANLDNKFKDFKSGLLGLEKEFANLISAENRYGAEARKIISTADQSGKSINKLRSELTQLSKAYDREKQAISTLKAKYSELLKAENSLGSAARKLISDLEKEKTSLSVVRVELSKVKKEFDSLTKINAKFKPLLESTTIFGNKARKLYSDTVRLGGSFKTLEANLASMDKEFRRVSSTSSSATTKIGKFGTAIERLNRSLVSFMSYRLASSIINSFSQALSSGVSSIADFDQALKDLQAITSATNSEVAAMGDKILEVANTTKFSATEVAQAMRTLGQAGLSASEAINVIDAVANLATGTLSDMSSTVNLVTTAMRVFNIASEDSSHISDIFANAVNKSKLTIDKLNTAMNYVGPVAKAAGLELEDVSAAMMVLANSGIRASSIGTGLRRVLAELVDPSAKLKVAVESVGLTLRDIDPNVTEFSKVIENMGLVVGDSRIAFELFGKRGASAILALTQNQGSLDSMLESVSRSGTAADMAAKQMEGLAVSFKNLMDKLSNLAIAFGNAGFTDVLKALVDILRDVTSVMTDFFNSTLGEFIVKWGLAATTISLFLPILSSVITSLPKLISLFKSLISFNLVSYFTNVTASMVSFTAGTEAATAAFGAEAVAAESAAAATGLFGTVLSGLEFLFNPIILAVSALITAGVMLTETYDDIVDEFNKLMSEAASLDTTLSTLKSTFIKLSDGKTPLDELKESAQELSKQIKILALTYPELSSDADAALSSIDKFNGKLKDGGEAVSRFMAAVDKLQLRKLVDAYEKSAEALDKYLNSAAHSVFFMTDQEKQIQKLVNAYHRGEISAEDLYDAISAMGDLDTDWAKGLKKALENIFQPTDALIKKLLELGDIDLSMSDEQIRKILEDLEGFDGTDEDIDKVIKKIHELQKLNVQKVTTIPEKWARDTEDAVEELNKYIKVYESNGGKITGVQKQILEGYAKEKQAIIDAANEAKRRRDEEIRSGGDIVEAKRRYAQEIVDLERQASELIRRISQDETLSKFKDLEDAKRAYEKAVDELGSKYAKNSEQYYIQLERLQRQYAEKIKGIVNDTFAANANSAKDIIKITENVIKELEIKHKQYEANILKQVQDGVIDKKKANQLIEEDESKLLVDIENTWKQAYESIKKRHWENTDDGKKAAEELANAEVEAAESASDKIKSAYTDRYEAVKEIYDEQLSAIKELYTNTLLSIETALSNHVITEKEAAENILQAILDMYKQRIAASEEMLSQLSKEEDNENYKKALKEREKAVEDYKNFVLKTLDKELDERRKTEDKIIELSDKSSKLRADHEKFLSTVRSIEAGKRLDLAKKEDAEIYAELDSFSKKYVDLVNTTDDKIKEAEQTKADTIKSINEKLKDDLAKIEEDKFAKIRDINERIKENNRSLAMALLGIQESTEDKIARIRQRGMTEAQKEQDNYRRALEKLSKAEELLAQGVATKNTKFIDQAKLLFSQSQDLFGSLQNTETAIDGVSKAGEGMQRALSQENAINNADLVNEKLNVEQKAVKDTAEVTAKAAEDKKKAETDYVKTVSGLQDELKEKVNTLIATEQKHYKEKRESLDTEIRKLKEVKAEHDALIKILKQNGKIELVDLENLRNAGNGLNSLKNSVSDDISLGLDTSQAEQDLHEFNGLMKAGDYSVDISVDVNELYNAEIYIKHLQDKKFTNWDLEVGMSANSERALENIRNKIWKLYDKTGEPVVITLSDEQANGNLNLFKQKLEQLKAEGLPIDIQIVNKDIAYRDLEETEAKIKDIDSNNADVEIAVKGDADRDLDEVSDKVDVLDAQKADIDVDVKSDNAEWTLENLIDSVFTLTDDSKKIKLDIDANDVNEKLDSIAQKLNDLGDESFDISVNVDSDTILESLETIKEQLDIFSDPVVISLEIDDNDVSSTIVSLNEEISRLNDEQPIVIAVESDVEELKKTLDMVSKIRKDKNIDINIIIKLQGRDDFDDFTKILTDIEGDNHDVSIKVLVEDVEDAEELNELLESIKDKSELRPEVNIQVKNRDKLEETVSLINDLPDSITVHIVIEATQAIATLQRVQSLLNSLHDKTITITTIHQDIQAKESGGVIEPTGFSRGGLSFRRRSKYVGVGSGLRDDVPALLKKGEFIVRAEAVRKYGVGLVSSINNMTFSPKLLPQFASGGYVGLDKLRERLSNVGNIINKSKKVLNTYNISFKNIGNNASNVLSKFFGGNSSISACSSGNCPLQGVQKFAVGGLVSPSGGSKPVNLNPSSSSIPSTHTSSKISGISGLNFPVATVPDIGSCPNPPDIPLPDLSELDKAAHLGDISPTKLAAITGLSRGYSDAIFNSILSGAKGITDTHKQQKSAIDDSYIQQIEEAKQAGMEEYANMLEQERSELLKMNDIIASELINFVENYSEKLKSLYDECGSNLEDIVQELTDITDDFNDTMSELADNFKSATSEYEQSLAEAKNTYDNSIKDLKGEYEREIEELDKKLEELHKDDTKFCFSGVRNCGLNSFTSEGGILNRTTHTSITCEIQNDKLCAEHKQAVADTEAEKEKAYEEYRIGKAKLADDYRTKKVEIFDTYAEKKAEIEADRAAVNRDYNEKRSELIDLSKKLFGSTSSNYSGLLSDYNTVISEGIESGIQTLLSQKDSYTSDRASFEESVIEQIDEIKSQWLSAVSAIAGDIKSFLMTPVEVQGYNAQGDYDNKKRSNRGTLWFADGGLVPSNAGIPNKDSVLSMLMPEEFVMRTAAVKRFGVDFFKKLNNLQLPKFAEGGLVGTSEAVLASGTDATDIVKIDLSLAGGKAFRLSADRSVSNSLINEWTKMKRTMV